ncbi:hypothetical protein RB595_005682 [Gaeumannomyces hyphopodioides]
MSYPSCRRGGAIRDVQQSAEWISGNDQGVFHQDYLGHDSQYSYAQGQTPAYGGDTGFSGASTAPSIWSMDPATVLPLDPATVLPLDPATVLPLDQPLGHPSPLTLSAAPTQHIYSSTTAHQAYGHAQPHTPIADPALSGLGDSTTTTTDMDDPVYAGKFDEEALPDLEVYRGEDGQYHCDEENCSVSHNNLRNFKKHKRTHLKPVICPLSERCGGKRTAEQRDMIRHVRAYHSGWAGKQPNLPQDDFACSICKQEFTRKDNLRKHTKLHEKQT